MTWERITCEQREAMVDRRGRSFNGFAASTGVGVLASRTDIDGAYGRAEVFTEWGYLDSGVPLLRDIRWPKDDAPCEHYRFIPASRDTP